MRGAITAGDAPHSTRAMGARIAKRHPRGRRRPWLDSCRNGPAALPRGRAGHLVEPVPAPVATRPHRAGATAPFRGGPGAATARRKCLASTTSRQRARSTDRPFGGDVGAGHGLAMHIGQPGQRFLFEWGLGHGVRARALPSQAWAHRSLCCGRPVAFHTGGPGKTLGTLMRGRAEIPDPRGRKTRPWLRSIRQGFSAWPARARAG